jgi:predicted glycoside hydrolase/deacetylase ChbG (UPF0249 family)
MKYLIVNADDLGASPGITRGILEAHAHGIVTSTSFMVNTPWSREAAALARPASRLSVGLHVDLAPCAHGVTRGSAPAVQEAIRRQYDRFAQLMGRSPTHIDSHHNAHRHPSLLEGFLAVARETGLPLREHSPVRYFSNFYGQWSGESHPEHVSVESLLGMIEREAGDGITELGCHPGYHDPHLSSGYGREREVELATLCDPQLPGALARLGVRLASFHDFARLTASVVRR